MLTNITMPSLSSRVIYSHSYEGDYDLITTLYFIIHMSRKIRWYDLSCRLQQSFHVTSGNGIWKNMSQYEQLSGQPFIIFVHVMILLKVVINSIHFVRHQPYYPGYLRTIQYNIKYDAGLESSAIAHLFTSLSRSIKLTYFYWIIGYVHNADKLYSYSIIHLFSYQYQLSMLSYTTAE